MPRSPHPSRFPSRGRGRPARGRRVVDAVADHRDDAGPRPGARDHVDLLGGQHLGDHRRRCRPRRRRRGDGLVVAGEQDRRQTQAAQLRDRLGAGRLDRVGDDEHAARLAVPGRPRRPSAHASACGPSRRARPAGAGPVGEQRRRRRRGRRGRRRRRRRPVPGDVLERLDRRSSPTSPGPPRAIARAIGCSEAASSAPATQQHLGAASHPRPAMTSTSVHPAGRHGAGLVEHDGVDRAGRPRAPPVPDQDAELRAAAGADQQRGRRRQAERAGAGDDQHGDRGGERGGRRPGPSQNPSVPAPAR